VKEVVREAVRLKEITGLNSSPVGVKFYFEDDRAPGVVEKLSGYRYCQALMRARHGTHVSLGAHGITCPAAAAAFGFKALPEGLRTGKGLVGFGIVKDEASGSTMFENMTVLPMGKLNDIYLFPLEEAIIEPDIIVVEDETEKLMWIALAYLNVTGGKRIESSTAILQATCVDATLIPYVSQRLNMSMGCYGCRDATDISQGETVLGFPFRFLNPICDSLEHLNEKAIPNSRGKNALAILKRKNAEELSLKDPFKN
jgi:uncharacterized protein (DUF169 family)